MKRILLVDDHAIVRKGLKETLEEELGQLTFGEADHARGRLDGDTWTWLSETRLGSRTLKGRLTMKMISATAYDFKFETSADGVAWNTVLEGKDTRK